MLVRLLVTLVCLHATVVHGHDVIIRVNESMSDAIKSDLSFQNPGMASRTMAMTNLAMYDAFNGISGEHRTFFDWQAPPTGANPEVAALQAGYRVLSSVYPHLQTQLDRDRSSILATLPQDAGTALGIDYGNAVGANIFQQRLGDGFKNMVNYQPTNAPGHWQPDPLNPDQTAWGPEWGQIRPFGMQSADQFMPNSMPDLASASYASAFNEVKSLGAKNSVARTADQTEAALFWAYDRNGMGTPIRMYNQVLRTVSEGQNNSVSDNARLFALASSSMVNAGIVAWDSKFEYDFWRPITGIRQADSDGNPNTDADPNWEPLGAPGGTLSDGTMVNDFTPPFPTYVSGHASFGGALFGSLQAFYGTDSISFNVTSEELPGVVRSFDSFSEAMVENGRSRVYLGIHWDFDDMMARDLGSNVATHMASNHFQSVPEPSFSIYGTTLVVMTIGLGLRRSRRLRS